MKRILSGILPLCLSSAFCRLRHLQSNSLRILIRLLFNPQVLPVGRSFDPLGLHMGQSPSIPLREEHGNTAFGMQRFDPITPWIVAMAVLLY